MPTYEYRCKECGQHVEVVQSFTDDALTTCGVCGGPLRKVFGSIGIMFKGSGFYKTDSRSSASSSGRTETKIDSGGDSKSDSKGDTKAKPDAAKADKSDSSDSKSSSTSSAKSSSKSSSPAAKTA